MTAVLLAGLLFWSLPSFAAGDATTFSVRCSGSLDGGKPACTMVEGVLPKADATGRFYDEINETGWGRLYVQSASVTSTTGYAAGYLEGSLTAERIKQTLSNYKAQYGLTTVSPEITAFVQETDTWTRKQIAAAGPNDQYWGTVGFIYDQLDGLLAGANDHLASDQKMSRLDIMLLGLMGDLDDIKLAIDASQRVNFEEMTLSEVSRWTQMHGHCSAIVKLVPDGTELFVGHNMWWSYAVMMMVVKHYEFGSLPAITMSSFPGILASVDDFYQTDKLVVMETTTTVYNHDLLASASASALPYWIRAMTANYLASTGPDWMSIFKKHNSGTYNNMWMVVDYSKFTPGSPLTTGLFTVGEQLPGYFHYEDQTFVLSYGYWPSYNVALYPETRKLSGQEQIEQKHPQLSYQESSRAQVFRRDQASVQSDEDMQRIMRYNKYQTDPLAHGNVCNQLACRADLPNVEEGSNGVGGGGGATTAQAKMKPKGFGAINAKYTSFSHFHAKRMVIVAGPTHDDQPVFQWSTAEASVQETPHLGQPDRFAFEWMLMTPDMGTVSPVMWKSPSVISNVIRLPMQGLICLMAVLGFTSIAWSVYKKYSKTYAEDDCYYKIESGKGPRPDFSPADLSTAPGSPSSLGAVGETWQFSPASEPAMDCRL